MLRERYFLIYLTSGKGKRSFIFWERNFFEIIRRKSINYIQNARNVESSLKFAKLERFPELGNWKVTRIPIMRVWIPKLMLLLFTINLRRNDEQTNIFRSEWIQNGFEKNLQPYEHFTSSFKKIKLAISNFSLKFCATLPPPTCIKINRTIDSNI